MSGFQQKNGTKKRQEIKHSLRRKKTQNKRTTTTTKPTKTRCRQNIDVANMRKKNKIAKTLK